MKAIELKGVSYRYPERDEYAIEGLDLSVEEGEFVLVTGRSGCGKSTVCRLLNGLCPKYHGGELSGSVFVGGHDVSKKTVAEMSAHVGLLFQDPEDQIVMSKVEGEIAFGLENMMTEPVTIGGRIGWVSSALGISHLLDRRTDQLSGGEKQKIVLASVLAMKPKVLALDEPTSQLDEESRARLFELLRALNEGGLTIIAVEHNVRGILGYVDRVFDLESGKDIVVESELPAVKKTMHKSGKVLVQTTGLAGGYGGSPVFEGVSVTVREGECLAVTGPNGAGKSTFVRHLAALMKPMSGSAVVLGQDTRKASVEDLAGKVAYLPQNPADMLFADTAEDELRFTLQHTGASGDVEAVLGRFGLLEHRHDYPRDLSVGQRQRLAIAAVLVADPKVVLLDEPTRGIDSEARRALVSFVHGMLGEGRAVVMVTQERDLVDELASEELKMVVRV
ncbi:MAG: ABC transporter ATP-binding protein [Candidatus Altiarchaeota archaeon]